MFHFSRLEWHQKHWEEQEGSCLYLKKLWVNPWRKGAGRCRVGRLSGKWEMIDHNPEYLDLYGQEPCYYGESLVLTGESMSQLGDMR